MKKENFSELIEKLRNIEHELLVTQNTITESYENDVLTAGVSDRADFATLVRNADIIRNFLSTTTRNITTIRDIVKVSDTILAKYQKNENSGVK